jgi:hypothetical protein
MAWIALMKLAIGKVPKTGLPSAPPPAGKPTDGGPENNDNATK